MVFDLTSLPRTLRRKQRTGYGVFVAEVTLHELDAVPLLSGRFCLSWRLTDHAAPRSALPPPEHQQYYPPLAQANKGKDNSSGRSSRRSHDTSKAPFASSASSLPSIVSSSSTKEEDSSSLIPNSVKGSRANPPYHSSADAPDSAAAAAAAGSGSSHGHDGKLHIPPAAHAATDSLTSGLSNLVPGVNRVHLEDDPLHLEPRGRTEFLPLKDYTVKVGRTFRLGLRIPAEKETPRSSAPTADAKASTAAAGSVGEASPRRSTASVTSTSNLGSVPPSPGTASISLPSDHEHSPHRHLHTPRSHSQFERDHSREAAAAHGSLAPTVLRISIKQLVESTQLDKDKAIPVPNTEEKTTKKKDSHLSLPRGADDAIHTLVSPVDKIHKETTHLGYIDLDLAEYAPWPREMATMGMPCIPLAQRRRTGIGSKSGSNTMHNSRGHSRSTSHSSLHGQGSSLTPSADAVERTETRRYLLKASRTNTRLLLSVTMRFVPAADSPPGTNQASTLNMWTVPSIQYGMTTGIGLSTLGMPTVGGPNCTWGWKDQSSGRHEHGIPQLLGMGTNSCNPGPPPPLAAALLPQADQRPTIQPPQSDSPDPQALVARLFDEARAEEEAKRKAERERRSKFANKRPAHSAGSLPTPHAHNRSTADFGGQQAVNPAKRLIHAASLSLGPHHGRNTSHGNLSLPSNHSGQNSGQSSAGSNNRSPGTGGEQHAPQSTAQKWKAITMALPTHLRHKTSVGSSGDSVHGPSKEAHASSRPTSGPDHDGETAHDSSPTKTQRITEEVEKVLSQSPVEMPASPVDASSFDRAQSLSFPALKGSNDPREAGDQSHTSNQNQNQYYDAHTSPHDQGTSGSAPSSEYQVVHESRLARPGTNKRGQERNFTQKRPFLLGSREADTVMLAYAKQPDEFHAGNKGILAQSPTVSAADSTPDPASHNARGPKRPPAKILQVEVQSRDTIEEPPVSVSRHASEDGTSGLVEKEGSVDSIAGPDGDPTRRGDQVSMRPAPPTAPASRRRGISPSQAAKLGLRGAGWRPRSNPHASPVVPANLV